MKKSKKKKKKKYKPMLAGRRVFWSGITDGVLFYAAEYSNGEVFIEKVPET